MVIDVHTHCFPDHIAPRAIASMLEQLHHVVEPFGDGTMKNLLDAMERNGVDKCVLCQIATKPTQHAVLVKVAKAIMDGEMGERAQRMIVPFASVHPMADDYASALAAVAAAGIKGIKLHPFYQDFWVGNPQLVPFFSQVRELGLVVQCHCGEDLGFKNDGRCGPLEIAKLLKAVPGLKFVAAHLGGWSDPVSGDVSEIVDLGCYADTATLLLDRSKPAADWVMRNWPAERLLFGTDYPWSAYETLLPWVRERRSGDALTAVLGGNAARLLGL